MLIWSWIEFNVGNKKTASISSISGGRPNDSGQSQIVWEWVCTFYKKTQTCLRNLNLDFEPSWFLNKDGDRGEGRQILIPHLCTLLLALCQTFKNSLIFKKIYFTWKYILSKKICLSCIVTKSVCVWWEWQIQVSECRYTKLPKISERYFMNKNKSKEGRN